MLLAPDVEMKYPNLPEAFKGRQAFRKWYADVLSKYFDETHQVESWNIAIEGRHATAIVVVRWETRSWEVGAAHSVYRAYLSRQRFQFARRDNGQVEITSEDRGRRLTPPRLFILSAGRES